jgi:hypothetical protein
VSDHEQSVAQLGLEPRGGRIGVAFDWGFAAQIALMSAAGLAGVQFGERAVPAPLALGGLAVAGIAVAQGEALRRGSGAARLIQIAGNGGLTLAGLLGLPATIAALQQGQVVQLYPALLLLVVSPLEVWLLMQPGSKQWYGHVSPEEARARHSGPWLRGTIAWALAGGILQTLAAIEIIRQSAR